MAEAWVYHRTMVGPDPHTIHTVTEAEIRARVFEVSCIECEGTGQFELPDGGLIPCVLCKTSGKLPVWI